MAGWFVGRLWHIYLLLAGADGFVLRIVHSRWQIFTTCTNIAQKKSVRIGRRIGQNRWWRIGGNKLSDPWFAFSLNT